METKGFCRARPALQKPQVVGYDSLSVGQKKKKKDVLLFWKKLVMPIGFTPSTSKLCFQKFSYSENKLLWKKMQIIFLYMYM